MSGVLLVSTSRALLVGSRMGLSIAAVIGGSGGGSSAFTGPYPSAISGLSGWWDAGLIANMVQPVAGASQLVSGLTDLSGNGNPMAFSYAAGSGSSGLLAWPRLNGALAGIGELRFTSLSQANNWYPFLSNPQFSPPQSVQMGSGSAWTRYLVWSRPNLNQAQNTVNTGTAQPLLSIGSTVVLEVTSNGVGIADSLILFPGSGQTVLSTAMERRHTHSITLRNTPGTGIDVWLDDTQIGTAIANPLGSSNSGTLRLLSSPTVDGQCFFHEFAMWERALSSGDIATLLTGTVVTSPNSAGSCSKRWFRGTRRGLIVGIVGQSNASNFFELDGSGAILGETLRYYLGLLSINIIGNGLISSGTPIYQDSADSSAWLANPGNGSSPSGWSTGTMGTSFVSTLEGGNQGEQTLTAVDLADLGALYVHWSENDSISHGYAGKANYNAAWQRMASLMRAARGAAASAFPIGWIDALPYGGTFNQAGVSGDNEIQSLRETLADLVADSALNIFVALPQSADCIGDDATYDALDGTWTGGDNNHVDGTDNNRFAKIAGLLTARALIGSGFTDSTPTLPAGLPVVGGPKIGHAYLENSTTVIVTIVHDAGNDLIVPLQSVNGVGWTVMDGGTVASPGTLRQATACARIDATHLQLTFPAIANAASACQLFYPWGYGKIGRGDAVTDNFSTVTKPAGFDIAADLGGLWSFNYPIAATGYGVVMSSAP